MVSLTDYPISCYLPRRSFILFSHPYTYKSLRIVPSFRSEFYTFKLY